MHFTFVLIASFIAATASGLPVDNDVEGKGYYLSSEHNLSGASGTFKYPLSGSAYRNNERVLITAGFPENTVFILENYETEAGHDKITFYKWSGDDLVQDNTYSGTLTGSKYFLPEGNFLITFESDSGNQKSGFSLRWTPLETLLLH